MKTTKFIITVCVVFLCTVLLFAEEPTEKRNNTNLEDLIVLKLNDDVQLTDTQRIIIKKKAKAFVSKSKGVNLNTTSKENFEIKKHASDEYEILLDSILTEEQKGQRAIKIKQRAEKASKVNYVNHFN
ncbi:MAG: hypothetical protein VB102_04335 [Paludibacter sp.]|nr:hypothetical protein [Paludibacter sp.]